jgi:hypothetical protein
MNHQAGFRLGVESPIPSVTGEVTAPYDGNFNIRKSPSPLGDIRHEIDRYEYGCFLESARGLPFYQEKVEEQQKSLVRRMGDLEVQVVQEVLKGLTEEEVNQWRHQLRTYHSYTIGT